MATRERPGDRGVIDAQEQLANARRELRVARRLHSMRIAAAARMAGMSDSQYGRPERGRLGLPTVGQVCCAARAVGLRPWLRLYPGESPVVDGPQLALLGGFEQVLTAPLWLRREVTLPVAGDLRAWDDRITDGGRTASIEAVARLEDIQALSWRIERRVRRVRTENGIILL
jgi:Helix-turn-helix domain